MAIEALHDLGTCGLVGAYDLTVIFRVELRGQRGRVHQVTEQYGKLSPFSGWCY
jgi:hypothetical protein